MQSLGLKIGNLQILDTTASSLTFEALVNLTNPTNYSATIPYADVHILTNGSLLAHATAKTLTIKPGPNINIPVAATWDPLTLGGVDARATGVELLSQYLSGMLWKLDLREHD